jgi:hypothetical protein
MKVAMKNIFLILLIFGVSLNGYSQDDENFALTNKKGMIILPAQGDLGFGIGAAPFFNYFGNFFSGQNQNNLIFNEPYFHLRYFVTDMSALRVKLGLNLNNQMNRIYVKDDFAAINDTISNKKTTDQQNLIDNSVLIDFGFEIRKGKSRLQGFFGGGPTIGYHTVSQKYAYGNPYSDINIYPTSSEFPEYENILSYGRVVEYREGKEWKFGLNIFLGTEYYFLPKASLGTQVDLNILYSLQGKSKREIEIWENGKAKTITEVLSPGGRSFNTITTHSFLNMFLMFHF